MIAKGERGREREGERQRQRDLRGVAGPIVVHPRREDEEIRWVRIGIRPVNACLVTAAAEVVEDTTAGLVRVADFAVPAVSTTQAVRQVDTSACWHLHVVICMLSLVYACQSLIG